MRRARRSTRPSAIRTEPSASAATHLPAARCRRRSPGSSPPRADCGTGTDLTLKLAIAPIQEAVVVSATRTEAPLAQLASSVTVFDARRRSPPSEPADDRPPPQRPVGGGRFQRQPGRGRVALPAWRREQLHEGPPRRHSAQRARRHVRFRRRDDREPRARRTGAGRAIGAVRVRRDVGRPADVHRQGGTGRRPRRGRGRGRVPSTLPACRLARPAERAPSTTPSAPRSTRPTTTSPTTSSTTRRCRASAGVELRGTCHAALHRARRARRRGHARTDRVRPARQRRLLHSATTASAASPSRRR